MSSASFSQDERLFKEIISGELTGKNKNLNLRYKFRHISSFYEIDLNSDGLDESIAVEKSDGEDWIRIHDALKRPLKRFKLDTVGKNSKVYRVSLRKLSSHTKVLIVYFYEGLIDYFDTRGSTRLYFLTLDNNDLLKMKIFKGPILFEEMKKSTGSYHLRNYHLSLFDYNLDGIKEIAVKYNKISRVFMYRGDGEWYRF